MDKKASISTTKNCFISQKSITNNFHNTIVIDEFGCLFAWGDNEENRLGFLKGDALKSDLIRNPTKYSFFSERKKNVIEVSMGRSHVVAVVKDKQNIRDDFGDVYTWGLDMGGRLGYISEVTSNVEEEINENADVVYRIPFKISIPGREKVSRVSCGSDFSACLSNTGKVYTFGNNKWGNLGLSKSTINTYLNAKGGEAGKGANVIREPLLVEGLLNYFIIQIACGDNHIIVLSKERKVFTWGEGANGRLGHGDEVSVAEPKMVEKLENEQIIFVAAGINNSAAINSKGMIFSWGNGKFGKLGLGILDDVYIPTAVRGGIISKNRFFFIALGATHTIAISLETKIFSCGNSAKGKLGVFTKSEVDRGEYAKTFKEIEELSNIQMIQCFAGETGSFSITSKGKIYAWGENKNLIFGELKEGKEGTKVVAEVLYSPMELHINKIIGKCYGTQTDLFKDYLLSNENTKLSYMIAKKMKIIKIACGGTHSLAITNTGDMLSWGFGPCGQLGHGEGISMLKSATLIKVENQEKFVRIYAGQKHSMAITNQSNRAYTWGDGKAGQLGTKRDSFWTPTKVEIFIKEQIIKGACGDDTTAFICSKGKVYICGSNENNKLGLDTKTIKECTPSEIKTLSNIVKISCGLKHYAAINSEGEVFTWGNGLFGQLGHGDKISQYEPKKIANKIPFKSVKCGTFQTVGLDTSGNVYVWGQGLLNLLLDKEKCKTTPDIIDDFKIRKAKKVVVGNGNSIVLTREGELYGWGHNEFFKIAGVDDQYITKNPRLITFENDKKRVILGKLFAGYDHIFAISESGEIYGWGNPRLFRITDAFKNEREEKFPKTIDIKWNAIKEEIEEKLEVNDDGDLVNKPVEMLDEIGVLQTLNKNYELSSFQEFLNIVKRLDSKYNDEYLIKEDEAFQEKTNSALLNLDKDIERTKDIRDLYIEIDQYLMVRIDYFKDSKQKKEFKSVFPSKILKHFSDFEKIYSLLFIHPCIIKTLVESGNYEDQFECIWNGIKPFYRKIFLKSSDGVDNITSYYLIALFRIIIDIDYFPQRLDLDVAFSKNRPFIEFIISKFFEDYYGQSLLFKIFPDTLKKIFELSSSTKDISAINVLNSIKDLVSDTLKSSSDYNANTSLKEKHITIIIELLDFLLDELVSNREFIPIQVLYCTYYLKKHIKKDQKSSNYFNKDTKDKMQNAINRFFFKFVIPNLLKKFFKENEYYLVFDYKFNVNSGTYMNFEAIIDILAILLERISSRIPLTLSEELEDIENEEEIEGIVLIKTIENSKKMLNSKFIQFYSKIYSFTLNVLLRNPEVKFSKPMLSSLINSQVSFEHIHIQVELKHVIPFFKFLSDKASKFVGDKNFEVFSHINELMKEDWSKYDRKLNLSLDTKYILKTNEFVKRFAYEVRHYKELNRQRLVRCISCNILLPHPFVVPENQTEFIVKPFEEKIKEEFMTYVTRFIFHKSFPIYNNFDSLFSIIEAFSVVAKRYKLTNQKDSDDYQNLKEFIDYLGRFQNNGDEKNNVKIILNDLHNHLRVKIKHSNSMVDSNKLMINILDIKKKFNEQITKKMLEFKKNKDVLKVLESSVPCPDNTELKDRPYFYLIENKSSLAFTNDGSIEYHDACAKLSDLKKKGLVLSTPVDNLNPENIDFRVAPDKTKRLWELRLTDHKTQQVIKSYNLTYDEFYYKSLVSNYFSNTDFEDFCKVNTLLLINLIHEHHHINKI